MTQQPRTWTPGFPSASRYHTNGTWDRRSSPAPPLSVARTSAAGGASAFGAGVAVTAGHDLGVREHRVDFPRRAVGIIQPELVLDGVAAGHAFLGAALQAFAAQALVLRHDLCRRKHLHTQVVQPLLGAGILDEHQLKRGLGDGEVGVARVLLRRPAVRPSRPEPEPEPRDGSHAVHQTLGGTEIVAA